MTDTEQNSDNIPCEKYSCSIVHWTNCALTSSIKAATWQRMASKS